MRFLLMIMSDEAAWNVLPPDAQAEVMAQHQALEEELRAAGSFSSCGGLGPKSQAATLRRTAEGDWAVTDGPFAESKEWMGGYYVVDVDSIDRAVEYAKRIPLAVPGWIEVREIVV